MVSIDFDDFEPKVEHIEKGVIAECPYFKVEKVPLSSPIPATSDGKFAIFSVVSGVASLAGTKFEPGSFFLAPASLDGAAIEPAEANTEVLKSTLPVAG
jgi:hypothetical protein